MKPEEPKAQELLAAYAAADVSPAEREAVERYLAAQPEAREELALIRSMLKDVAEAGPRPAVEPAWADMARRIGQACDEAAAEASRQEAAQGRSRAARQSVLGRVKARLAALMQPRYIAGMAVAMAALVLLLWRGQTPDTEDGPPQRVAVSEDRQTQPEAPESSEDRIAGQDLADLGEEPELAELSGDELDEVYHLLADDAAIAELDTGEAGDGGEADALAEAGDEVLSPAAVAQWLGDSPDPEEGEQDSGDELFALPAYDGLLEDLSEEELQRLDMYLQEALAG